MKNTAPIPRAGTRFEIHPLTPKRWPDFEAMLGVHGAYGGC